MGGADRQRFSSLDQLPRAGCLLSLCRATRSSLCRHYLILLIVQVLAASQALACISSSPSELAVRSHFPDGRLFLVSFAPRGRQTYADCELTRKNLAAAFSPLAMK